jgi:hypothetical protein
MSELLSYNNLTETSWNTQYHLCIQVWDEDARARLRPYLTCTTYSSSATGIVSTCRRARSRRRPTESQTRLDDQPLAAAQHG